MHIYAILFRLNKPFIKRTLCSIQEDVFQGGSVLYHVQASHLFMVSSGVRTLKLLASFHATASLGAATQQCASVYLRLKHLLPAFSSIGSTALQHSGHSPCVLYHFDMMCSARPWADNASNSTILHRISDWFRLPFSKLSLTSPQGRSTSGDHDCPDRSVPLFLPHHMGSNVAEITGVLWNQMANAMYRSGSYPTMTIYRERFLGFSPQIVVSVRTHKPSIPASMRAQSSTTIAMREASRRTKSVERTKILRFWGDCYLVSYMKHYIRRYNAQLTWHRSRDLQRFVFQYCCRKRKGTPVNTQRLGLKTLPHFPHWSK